MNEMRNMYIEFHMPENLKGITFRSPRSRC